MTDDLVEILKELQQKIEYDEEKTYSKIVIQEYRNPSNFGFIKNPDASGKIKGPCGDTMRIDLKIKDKRISDIRFWTDGCGASIASGSKLTKIVKEKTLQEARALTSEDLLLALDGLPVENRHCTVLAVDTLKDAISNYYLERKSLN